MLAATAAPVLVSPPAEAPVGADDLRTHLRIPVSVPDVVLDGLVAAAVAGLDAWSGELGLCLVTQAWEWALSGFPVDPLALPIRPVRSLEIRYDSPSASDLVLDPSRYRLVAIAGGHDLRLAPGSEWPETAEGPTAVRLRMTCGWPAAEVPADLRTAVLLIAGDLWSTAARSGGLRKEVVEKVGSEEWDTSSAVSDATRRVVDRLLARHRPTRV